MGFSNIHIGYCRKGVSFSYPQLLLNHMIEFNQTCFNFFLIDCRCAPVFLFFRFFFCKNVFFKYLAQDNIGKRGRGFLLSSTPPKPHDRIEPNLFYCFPYRLQMCTRYVFSILIRLIFRVSHGITRTKATYIKRGVHSLYP